jgi:hypothetical protein
MLRKEKFGQIDAIHFLGNQTFLISQNHVEQFRNLNYYNFSTQFSSVEAHLHYFRNELVFGWLAPKKKKNWREVVFVKGLANQNQPLFWEAGYGVDKLFRFLHVEVVRSQWEKDKGEWRIMLGTSFNFGISPRNYDKNLDQGLTL